MIADRESAILEVTEAMVREGGYNSFSFRNIATAVGIKSSSVHYHFATKEDLGVAITKHYSDKFIASLGDHEVLVAQKIDPIKVYVNAFRTALAEDQGMCLCGMLGAEIDILPKSVADQTRLFFKRNVDWLEKAYQAVGEKKNSKARAIQTLSLLEGAMIASKVFGEISVFDQAAELFKR